MSKIITNPQYYSDIADAIRAKNGESGVYYPSQMAGKVADLQVGGVTPADIYNHGSVVGINKYYQCYECQNDSASYAGFNITKNYYNNYSGALGKGTLCDNSIMALGGSCYKNNYRYLCADVEVTNGRNTNWNWSQLGIRYNSKGAITRADNAQANKYIWLVNFQTQSNYDGSSPWYNLSRQVVRMSLAEVDPSEPFRIVFFFCNEGLQVYSVWFE